MDRRAMAVRGEPADRGIIRGANLGHFPYLRFRVSSVLSFVRILQIR